MSKLRFRISMSVDGSDAGPSQSDEMEICLGTVLLGAAGQLFERVDELDDLESVHAVATPQVTRLGLARA